MSAPKPRVRCIGSWGFDDIEGLLYDYTWSCACGAAHNDPSDGGWDSVIESVIAHSQTHTAERIADELDRRAGIANADAAWKFERGWHSQGIEATGNSEGIESAAILVREHLVGGAS